MDLGLKGKVALVTASSKGIGFAAAKALAEEGADVAISSRSDDNLAKARYELQKSGADVVAVKADLRVREDLLGLTAQVKQRLGPVDILVYNAGPPKPGTFSGLTYADWEEATRLLLLSAVTLSEAVIPDMGQRGGGA